MKLGYDEMAGWANWMTRQEDSTVLTYLAGSAWVNNNHLQGDNSKMRQTQILKMRLENVNVAKK